MRALFLSSIFIQPTLGEFTQAPNAFARVVEALENAENDAKKAQKTNDDEFTKVQCLAQELIDEANQKIPVAKQTIAETTAKIGELRSENEALSIEATALDATVARLTKELAAKQDKRDQDKAKYIQDSSDMTRGVEMMDAAIKILTEGTANFLQVATDVRHKMASEVLAGAALKSRSLTREVLAASAKSLTKTGTSGQVIGVLTGMRTTFEENLQDMSAQEKAAAKYFKGYKHRTDQQIVSDSATSASHKGAIANNASTIKQQQQTKKEAEQTLQTMENQLATETSHLKEHTALHEEAAQESLSLIDAIHKAINLLDSEDAKKVMAKSVDKMAYPTMFFQKDIELTIIKGNKKTILAQKKALLWSKVAAPGKYGWGAIYTAIDDMVKNMQDEIKEAEEQFTDCEQQMRQHALTETDLEQKKLKRTEQKNVAQGNILIAQSNIKAANDEMASRNKEITEKQQAIRDEVASTQEQVADGKAAEALFKKAVEFLSGYQGKELKSEVSTKEGSDSGYDTSKISAGTAGVIEIIEKVEKSMMDELAQLQKNTEKFVGESRDDIKAAKESIEQARAFLADNKDSLADATKSKNSAVRYLAKIEEGLAAEAVWWGPAPGNEMPAAGQACITFTGRNDLVDTKNRDKEYSETKKEAGTGTYHELTKANTDEISALNSMKDTIQSLETDYLREQPANTTKTTSNSPTPQTSDAQTSDE